MKQGSIVPDWAQLCPFFHDTNIVVMIYSQLRRRYKHKIYVPKTRQLYNEMHVVYIYIYIYIHLHIQVQAYIN